MAYLDLTQRDINVLEKIKDPEYDPALAIQVDPTLPKDPHIADPELYQSISQRERNIILSIQNIEIQNAKTKTAPSDEVLEGYRKAVTSFDQLIEECPQYASARNNRAQALRRLYGDAILIWDAPSLPQALLQTVDDAERVRVGKVLLGDLDRAISLLTPTTRHSRLSPQVAKTLSMAHTQRAAIYLMTSKLMLTKSILIDGERPEVKWSKIEFEEHASADFAMGGRYGNEIAKGLAVSTNPTARLCGQMVREAMKKEYGPEISP
ncbi:hypothetical protein QBC40DRAFT_276269 [Triangularia verruculosa]|uniref:Tetratricopeptide repeat protein 36 n=1 Tax=Triangularia verruculosa TaxID=2587418 RepID=A0AAN6XLJ9_9PEZI|nr:hypothetical protein QBC40DRAFT_276269 [Triangularia verruculosa]